MERVCPSCNTLYFSSKRCRNCGGTMCDIGRAQDIYQDDYTANMPINDAVNYCIHVYKCERCQHSENIGIDKAIL
jgi:hypothetical protein